jgi:hypothetical protein
MVNELHPDNAYHVIVREFDPESWLLGPMYEVKIDKNSHAGKFS